MAAFALAGLTLILSYTAVRNGGVQPRDLYPALLGLAVLAGGYGCLASRRGFAPPPRRVLRWLLPALPLLCAAQLVPLPRPVALRLSPARVELEQAAAPVVGASGGVPLSAAPAATLPVLATVTGCVLILLLVRDIAWRFKSRPWIAAAPLIAVAALEAALALAQPAARGTWINRDHFASLLAMCLPLPLAWGLDILVRHLRRRETPLVPVAGACALFAVAALLLAAVVRSSSRMGFLAALVALFATGAAAARGVRAALAVALCVAAAFVVLPTDALIGRFAGLASTSLADETRLRLWRETLPLIGDYPLAGCGLGAYEAVMTRYKTVAPLHTVDYAHNDYLQLFAEGGALLALPFLLAAALVVVSAARGHSYLSTACVAALAALLFHALFDFSLHIPANAMAAAWIAGLATHAETSRDGTSHMQSRT